MQEKESNSEEMRQKLGEMESQLNRQMEQSQARINDLEAQLNSNNEIQSSLKVQFKLIIKSIYFQFF